MATPVEEPRRPSLPRLSDTLAAPDTAWLAPGLECRVRRYERFPTSTMSHRPGKYEPKKVLDDLDLIVWTLGLRRPLGTVPQTGVIRIYAPQPDRSRIAETIRRMLSDFGRGTRRFLARQAPDFDLPYGSPVREVSIKQLRELAVRVVPGSDDPEAVDPEELIEGRIQIESGAVLVTIEPAGARLLADRIENRKDSHGASLVSDGDLELHYSPDWCGSE